MKYCRFALFWLHFNSFKGVVYVYMLYMCGGLCSNQTQSPNSTSGFHGFNFVRVQKMCKILVGKRYKKNIGKQIAGLLTRRTSVTKIFSHMHCTNLNSSATALILCFKAKHFEKCKSCTSESLAGTADTRHTRPLCSIANFHVVS